MQRNQILAGRVGIEIFNNGVQVADRSLRSGQSFDFKVPGGYNTEYDGYEIHYAVHNSERWTPRMFYINVNPPCTQCLPSSIELSKQTEEDYSNNVIMKDNHIYIKQSENYNNKKPLNFSERLTMNELYTEFYDNNTNELTDQTKTISPDSQIEIIDVIKDVVYSEDHGYTTFKFNSEYRDIDYHVVSFNGNLSNEYEEGDSVELIFNVVKTANINGTTFVDLDYNLQDIKSDKFPSIDSFLKK